MIFMFANYKLFSIISDNQIKTIWQISAGAYRYGQTKRSNE